MKIELPQVGESITEAIIAKWLKSVGDSIKKFDPLVEVVTDKVNMEIPSPATGTLTNILVQEDQTVPIGSIIAEIAVENEESDNEKRIGSLMNDVTPVGPTGSGGPITTGTPPEYSDQPQRLSPAVIRMVKKHGIDLTQITGTGLNDRVTLKDVQAFIGSPTGDQYISSQRDKRIGLTPIRQTIARNMVRSTTDIPEAWTVVEADVTNLVAIRNALKVQFKEREGVNLSYLAFILRAVAKALKDTPIVNSSWDGDSIIIKPRVNIGVAVNSPKGLVVPVVHEADQMDITKLCKTINRIVTDARQNKLSMSDIQNGTFTVNNTGALGSVIGKAIINYPQAAILNMEAIVKRPIVIDDTVVVRSMMNLCLTFDHRVMDGAEASTFVGAIKSHLESLGPNVDLCL